MVVQQQQTSVRKRKESIKSRQTLEKGENNGKELSLSERSFRES